MKTDFMLRLGNPFGEEKLPTWRENFGTSMDRYLERLENIGLNPA